MVEIVTLTDSTAKYHTTKEAAVIRHNTDGVKLWRRRQGISNSIKPWATGNLPESRLEYYEELPNPWKPTITDRTAETVREFVSRMYRFDRLCGRGSDYAEAVFASAQEELDRFGYVTVSRYEAVDGQTHFWEPLA